MDKLRPYTFHGVTFDAPRESHKDAYGSCPFCHNIVRGAQKTGRFAVNLDNGLFRCWHCNESGNVQTFLTRIHQLALEKTTHAHYQQLAADRRGIPWQQFRDSQLALDHRHGSERATTHARWLIPTQGLDGRLTSLRVYRPGQAVIGTAGLPLELGGLPALAKHKRGPVILCEGEWDYLALEHLRKTVKAPSVLLYAPGASVFKKEWSRHLAGRDVYIAYDNDSAGEDGIRHTADLLRGIAASIYTIRWPAETVEGYDVRDLLADSLEAKLSPALIWSNFLELFQREGASSSDSGGGGGSEIRVLPKRTKFSTIVKDFSERLFFDKPKQNGLAIMHATVASVVLPGDPLWTFIVAPPGGGKTMLLESFRKSRWCIFRSSVHPAMLISGMDLEDDPSLIPKLKNKTLVLKDYTEIISMPREKQEEIYGILRGAYDGHAMRSFGNGVDRDYDDCHFSLLAGVTDVIHGDDRAALGERFLKYQLVTGGSAYDQSRHIAMAISGMSQQLANESFLRDVTEAFLEHTIEKLESGKIPAPEDWVITRLTALTQIVAHLRTSVPRTYRDELLYRPAPEIGARLGKQLMKLAQTITVVWGLPRITKDVLRLVEQVAFDTARGWGLDIVSVLARSPTPLLREHIEHAAHIPSTTCHRKLENLLTVGTVMREVVHTGRDGHPPYGWTLSPELRDLWHQAKIGE